MDQKKGIFDTLNTPEAHTEPNMDIGEMLEDDTLEESTSGAQSLVAHHIWLNFLAEVYQVISSSGLTYSLGLSIQSLG